LCIQRKDALGGAYVQPHTVKRYGRLFSAVGPRSSEGLVIAY